jgi:RecA/RadA recombinase
VSIDSLLGGGVRSGILTDIYGQSGSGKSQLCFTLCVNYIKSSAQEDRIMFVDTAGTFRPERIVEIAGDSMNSNILNKIIYIRALSTADQDNAIRLISSLTPKLTILDSATSLFSSEFKGVARHLALMKYLHQVSLNAIRFDCAIVMTNMVRNVPSDGIITGSQDNHAATSAISGDVDRLAFGEREFMGTSVSIYAHMKLKVRVVDRKNSIFGAYLMQPKRDFRIPFYITSKGICG